MGIVMAYKVGDRVTLSCDVPVRHPKAVLRVMLEKGERGTVVRDHAAGELYVVRFDSYALDVIIAREQMVHAVDELALLRAQLAARDAALDAVLEFATQAHERPETFG